MPGCRNAKRWQDVQEILAADIDVVTTLNIRHLESLADVVWPDHRDPGSRSACWPECAHQPRGSGHAPQPGRTGAADQHRGGRSQGGVRGPRRRRRGRKPTARYRSPAP
ncbi:hypothetical protein [Catenulispora sp. GP43]|uniref:hypothetical protein n=1 Tax=Catenulispora sp. GP43 TaxID=3156263 RepID=UPI00351873C4